MNIKQVTAEIEQIVAESKKEGFSKWLDQPAVRLALTMIPQGEHHDALKMVLQSAFESGHDNGSVAVASHLMRALMKDKM